MGLFRELGRRAERFKQDVQAAAEGTAAEEPTTYHCAVCDARFPGPREQCPECTAADIAPVRPPE